MRKAFSFSVPGARYKYAHKQWLQEKALNVPEDERQGWDGKASMMTDDNTIPVGLLLGAKEELAKAGFDLVIEKWINKPSVYFKKGFIEKDSQYNYQNNASLNMQRCIVDFGGGLILSATGTGKTKIAAQFFSWLDCKVLFVVAQIALLYQSQKEIQMWLKQEGYATKVGVVGNGVFDPQEITIATIQTLFKAKSKAKFKEWFKEIKVVLIDEIHVQMSRRNFGILDKIKPQAVIGLTATMQMKRKPVRFKCWSICGPVIFDFPMKLGVEAGVLSQGVVIQVPAAKNNNKRRMIKTIEAGKELWRPVDDYMHEVVYNKNANILIQNLTKQLLAEGKCVVVLVERIRHLKILAKRLKADKPKLFWGKIDKDTRKDQLEEFEAGDADLIIANGVFTKGINVKRIDAVIDGAQRGNRNDCLQKFGRAVRLHKNKDGIWYFDIFTQGREKPAKQRSGAFKKAKIPIKVLTKDFTLAAHWSPKGIISHANKLLQVTLKKNKQIPLQGKLF